MMKTSFFQWGVIPVKYSKPLLHFQNTEQVMREHDCVILLK
jgi:hypothetical protein